MLILGAREDEWQTGGAAAGWAHRRRLRSPSESVPGGHGLQIHYEGPQVLQPLHCVRMVQ